MYYEIDTTFVGKTLRVTGDQLFKPKQRLSCHLSINLFNIIRKFHFAHISDLPYSPLLQIGVKKFMETAYL